MAHSISALTTTHEVSGFNCANLYLYYGFARLLSDPLGLAMPISHIPSAVQMAP